MGSHPCGTPRNKVEIWFVSTILIIFPESLYYSGDNLVCQPLFLIICCHKYHISQIIHKSNRLDKISLRCSVYEIRITLESLSSFKHDL